MLVLGIESSAHTFGVGVVGAGRVMSNEKAMFPISDKGLIPSKVAETHVKNAPTVVQAALDAAGVRLSEVEGIGYTRGPGLGPCLQVGELTAKSLAQKLAVPIAQVNHGVAHIEVTRLLTKMRDPLALYVSGGNSQILKATAEPFRHYAILGETFDIGVGNMFDNFARGIGLNPAWGSTVGKMASGGNYVKLPYTVKGMDFAFTGLLTNAIKLAATERKEDLCYSIQETAFSMLCEATERAMFLTKSTELCVCGGVAQSRRLKEMLKSIANEHRIKFGACADEYNADNGAMIAVVAERMLKKGMGSMVSECGIEQRYRVDRAVIV
ncbi:MAG: tRNA (adenosine(37)-N6)-threonylcarbamoyltransferase complex transferase subunit TsaD [Candidatus Micrarchaeota archaeon]|nr:tRNA (adenosine(37)-N6)-threonylcarbamoyltransferase complex transferase subunit TsaD [Candidatus Micrarchaeota archaeon]MDE1804372.1 tRNA (adenosine(37)-N6)-threonylcarbamoyltransferase complex transferase subunit TsaD [Candidatus Micrarchaeota archaeon]MDE1846616.1 tRNA (adenosine(37)-N6)-threonylcarbamoyltransferase complex transferase subunit TsaD [Candidatus Micrarchaeota archaeon]